MIVVYEDKYIVIGAKISYHRKLLRMTQEQLSDQIGISKSHLSRIERGQYPNGVSLAILYAIADGLKIDIKDLL